MEVFREGGRWQGEGMQGTPRPGPITRANRLDDLPENPMEVFSEVARAGARDARERKLASPFTFPLQNAKPLTHIEG